MPLPGLDYYDQQYRARKAAPVPVYDPLEVDLRKDRDQEIRESLFLSASPDTVARVSRVSRETGEPPLLVEDRVDAYEKSVANDRFMMTVGQYPALGKWAVNNPRGSAAAADDSFNLAKFGRAFTDLQEDFLKDDGWLEQAGDFMSRRVRGIQGGFDRFAVATDDFFESLTPDAQKSAMAKVQAPARRQKFKERAEFNEAVQGLTVRNEVAWSAVKKDPSVGNIATFIRQQGASSIPDLVLAVANLPIYAAGRSGEIGQQRAVNSGRKEADVGDVAVAAPAALLSGYLDRLGFQKLVLPGADTALKRIATAGATEAATEFAQEIIEYGGETLGTDVAFDPAEALDRGAAGAVGGAGVATPLRAAGEVPTMVRAVAPVVSKILSGGKARAEGKTLDDMMKASQASKLRERDPEAFKDMLRTMGEDAGTSNVLISGEALQEYMQSDAYDPDGPLSSWTPQVEEAAATKGDVVMPIEEAMTLLPGAWETIKDDVRLTNGGATRREAQTFDEAMADVMDELATSMAEQDRATALKLEPVQKLAESINRKLQDAGFTPSTAKIQADLLVQRYSTRASRLGKELTGDEFGVTINNVLPEGLAAARKADTLDLVINSYFNMKNPDRDGRKSLLDFIAERGGITDRGGDLKSMGLDNRKFKKKVIRDTRQTDMLGTEGNNKYAPDAVLQAAIEEGYFPELQGRDEIDGNVLMEAISEELRGAPRYNADRIADDVRELAGQLDEFLGQTGYDPANMTQTEMRAALEATQDAQVGGYEQDARWAASVDAVIRGDKGRAVIRLGATPKFLTGLGFPSGDLVITRAKLAKARREHPEVALDTWRELPSLLTEPRAAFPSAKDDGSYIVAIDAVDADNNPVIVPIIAEQQGGNVVLSVYGKENGQEWIAKEIIRAEKEAKQIYVRDDLADDLVDPKDLPGDAPTQAPIASVVPAKRARKILSLGDVVNKTFEQSYDDNARGKITFNSGQATIDLFKTRNLSTFLHETGHLWLEELRFDASLSDAPDELKADWETVNKWFASQGHSVKDGQIPVDAHEMWARGVERYLMEGKSPVPALKRIFETFRVWLTAIYKTVDALKSPITPEIRSVMDRLIATDTELAEMSERQGMEALFKDAADAGMTGAEYAAYVEQTAAAKNEATGAMIDKTMRAFRARETKRYREAEAGVREEITDDVDARPMYKALRLLKTAPMDAEWVKAEFGADSVSLLPVRVPPIAKSGGLHPDVLAEQSGFATGKEMVETLMGADIAHRQAKEGGDTRSMRERTISAEVDAVMQARYGDVLNDGSIEREALEAVHNDMQGDVIAAEIRVLGRRTGRRATPYGIAKDWARGKIRSGVVRDEASPSAIQRYARAAARASSEAQAAMLKQDIDGAFKAKQAQMLNNALVFEAKQALDDVTRAVKRLEKIAKRRTMKSVDQDYLEQAQALLENVDMRRRSQVGIDKEGTLAEWAAARQAEGFDVVVSQSFEALIGKTNWTKLSVENLLGLDEAVKQIIHLGRNVQAINDDNERRAFDEVVAEAVQGAGNLRQKPPSDLMQPSFWDGVKSKILAADAALLKMETVFDWLDSKNSSGVFNRVVFRPIADAQEQSRLMMADYIGRLTDALKAVPADTLKRWADKVETSLINRETGRPFIFTRDQLVSMALNVGNQSNLDKLTGGYSWQEGEVLSVLAQELTQEEWAYVQSVWDTIETLWPQIEAMEKRLNGVAPEKVVARPVETPFGTLAGGYFPVVYDPRKNYDAEANAAKNSNLFETLYTRASTPRGFTKERTKVERPIHLSLGIINRHVSEVIHDVTHREAIMQADKFLSSKRIMKAVDDTMGPEVRKMFRPWLQRIANEWAQDRAGSAGVENLIKQLRLNTTIVGMGFRASTILMQGAGLSNSFEVVGPQWVTPRIKDALLPASYDFVLERSKEVAGRMSSLDRDMRDNVREAMGKNEWLTAPKRFAFHGIAYMDRVVVIPTWLGAYDKAIAGGMAEQDAIYAADKAVRQSQGSGAAKDLASVQSGRGTAGEALKLLTMFYSYMSAFYQRERTLGRDVRNGSSKDIPVLLARAWWLVIVPPVLAQLLAGKGPDEDEEWPSWSMEQIMFQLLGPIPVARDAVPVAYAKLTDKPTFGYRFTPAAAGVESAMNVAGDIGNAVDPDEETKRATRNAIETVGYFTGLTTGQMAVAAQFMVDVSYDEKEPETVGQWWDGLTTGKFEEAE